MIDISGVLLSPEWVQPILVERSKGEWIKGRFVKKDIKKLTMMGTVTNASPEDLELLSEADRMTEARTFHTPEVIYLTRDKDGESGISDIITWRGERYRVRVQNNNLDYGFCRSIGVRERGV
jgi:hypothetical protein